MEILLGDCLNRLKEIKDCSIDSIITDPPYGLGFMGKKWDYDVPSVEIWKECLRVLKPGGHLLSFGGTRTYHRLVVNIEDAGFEIRDCIQWLYGSGFPKSTNVALRIDKESGEIGNRGKGFNTAGQGISLNQNKELRSDHPDYMPPEYKTEAAKQWQGWGTALKPANEPICVARKPLEKGLTVAENVLKWGCGAINIDASRIGQREKQRFTGRKRVSANAGYSQDYVNQNFYNGSDVPLPEGRWPANIIFDEITGCAEWSRFFYIAKASKSERNKGLEGMPLVESGIKNDSGRGFSESDPHKKILNQNFHPTVKPIKLMEYLIKLVTPPNGTVLDPFMGSGSTGVAAKNLKYKFTGCEMNPEYFEIAKKRIEYAVDKYCFAKEKMIEALK